MFLFADGELDESSTLWVNISHTILNFRYRAPECLLTYGQYSLEMDIWSVGCVMYELLTAHPLFPGKNEAQQLNEVNSLPLSV